MHRSVTSYVILFEGIHVKQQVGMRTSYDMHDKL